MPRKVRTYQDTPNPQALKCILDGRIVDKPRSFFSAADAAADPLGSRLFAIPGVTNILIHPEWITVGKSPEVPWKSIKQGLERVLDEAP